MYVHFPVPFQKPMMKHPLPIPVAFFAFVIAASASETCKELRVPAGQCATLYDDEDCNGWSVDISNGYTELSFKERNEAEAVVVRPGCKFIGMFMHLLLSKLVNSETKTWNVS